MTIQEADRRRRQRAASHAVDRVLTFAEWCDVNGFSAATGRRILAAGKCRYVQLSERRIGIRESDNAAYQAACLRGGE